MIFQTHFKHILVRCGSGASVKMWLWVMIVVVKTLNHHQMIHFCMNIMITISTWAKKWYSRFWTMSKETWWEVLWQPKLHRLTKNWKNCSYYLHHQNFHKKPYFIVIPIVWSQIASIVVLHDLIIGSSCPKFHKWGHGLEDMSSHGSSKNDGLKKVKLEFLDMMF